MALSGAVCGTLVYIEVFSVLVVGFPNVLEKKIKTKYLRPEISVVEFIGILSIAMLILGWIF